MGRTFRCKHCGEPQRLNPRLKAKQKYCSKEACKNARKRDWANHQYAEDPDFREKSKQRQKSWRKNHSTDQYQKQYRESHPMYADGNRQLQQSRNKTRPSTLVSTIIKPSALILHFKENGACFVSRVIKEVVVNQDALCSQEFDK